MENDWHKNIKDVRKKYQKVSLREKKKMEGNLFSKVPEIEGVAFVINKIEELCNEDVAELTWDDVKRIEKRGKLTSDNHKTGHYYDQEMKIDKEQFPWLNRLREEFRKKHGYRPKLVFGTALDTKDHSL